MEFSEPAVDLSQLLTQFHSASAWNEIGSFDALIGEHVPEPYRKLLDHHSHMTVAVESHFGSQVDVKVVRSTLDKDWYSREILLTTQSDGLVVQYGIVRLRYGVLAEPVWNEIRGGLKPLGRVLIEHDVLRQVELVGLWKVKCGRELARHFSVPQGSIAYGRTARIFCDLDPAIELLEIIRPGELAG
jgi:hypothetical protein